jgi:hypothetical protein
MVVHSIGVHVKDTINMVMEDLTEEDRKDLEEEMAERHRRKLSCFQKTRFVKKLDTATTFGIKVDSPLSPKDLIHMIDVFVASKYGADLTQFTCVVAEDMRNTLDEIKQDISSNLPRQVRALVQQINGEAQGKCVERSTATPSLDHQLG